MKEDNEEEGTGFLEVGNIITIDEIKFEITKVNFKLENPSIYPKKNIKFDYFTDDENSKTNSTIHIFIKEKINK